jgi:hypothetical protein
MGSPLPITEGGPLRITEAQNEDEKCTVRCTSAAPIAVKKRGGQEGGCYFFSGVSVFPRGG